MLFNSIDFAIFLPIVFILYWFVLNKNLKLQNLLLVAASYLFYGWWDWRFLSLIIISTIVDYLIGLGLGKETEVKKRKLLLLLSFIVNLGLLGFFKYYNFFIENFTAAFSFFGGDISTSSLNIILPVGISFYTFQTLSYSIDVYRKKLRPTNDFIVFASFVSFFPQLVAGPIERATNLLPQIESKRLFSSTKSIQGLYQILWGLFKKIVVADNCAPLVDTIFSADPSTTSGSLLVVGAILFAFQIYCDFSGYSDIAIGVAKLFGIQLMTNFRFPYFSRNIGEFWRRWHISLSTWFRDYLYIPLGGSKEGKFKALRNIFIIFLVSGFWHGANWTFIIWGAFHAFLFLPNFLIGTNRKYKNQDLEISARFSFLTDLFKMGLTFLLVTIGWVFFRAENLTHAINYLQNIPKDSILAIPKLVGKQNTNMLLSLMFIFILICVEWFNRNREFVFEKVINRNVFYQLFIIGSVVTIIFFFTGSSQGFIYFQF